ncbi:MAG: DUF899 family protein [Phyllobacteriaceae bacterium]|nr:DUF899 family protein [Phyllobacteriaceae bacterium]
MSAFHDMEFPGESAAYREARDRLLDAERELRRQVETVAELRRALPPGGLVHDEYRFASGFAERGDDAVETIGFSELFAPGKDTLVIYQFMFAPGAKAPCPMCTAFVDSLVGAAPHLHQRVNLAVVAKAPIERLLAFARSRDWSGIRLVSAAGTQFNTDYNAERGEERQLPVLSVFTRSANGIHHTYSTELGYMDADPGQNPRHLDMMWPLWNVLDMTPEGRGADWYPSLNYAEAVPA